MDKLSLEICGYIDKAIDESGVLKSLYLKDFTDLRFSDNPQLKFVQLQLYNWAIQKIPNYLQDQGVLSSHVLQDETVLGFVNTNVPRSIHQNVVRSLSFLGRVAKRYNELSPKAVQYNLLNTKYPSVEYVLKELERDSFAFLRGKSEKIRE